SMVGIRQPCESKDADRCRHDLRSPWRVGGVPRGRYSGGRSAEDCHSLFAAESGGGHRPHMVRRAVLWLAQLLACADASAQTVYTYIGQLRSNSVLIAWGNTTGRGNNTIGRDSVRLGAAQVRIAGRSLDSAQNWINVTGLEPDTA